MGYFGDWIFRKGPLNIVSDSCYVVNALKILEVAGVIKPSSTVFSLFCDIQDCLLRAHSGLPGPLAAGNNLADKATRLVLTVIQTAEQNARDFNSKFRATAETLRQFGITCQQARDIVAQCRNCCQFLQFCAQMQVTHITGLPYNPQGQGIVERAHFTLKSYLFKQKGCIIGTPRAAIALAQFTINFLNLDDFAKSAAERHCLEPKRPKEFVKWKDVLSNSWRGPDPILIRSRGAVCVFPQDEQNPLWIPERLTRTVLEQEKDAELDHLPPTNASDA